MQYPVDGEQHDPEPGQELGTQTPFCVQVLGALQLTWMTLLVHAPLLGEQHEPVGGCGQGLGEQTP